MRNYRTKKQRKKYKIKKPRKKLMTYKKQYGGSIKSLLDELGSLSSSIEPGYKTQPSFSSNNTFSSNELGSLSSSSEPGYKTQPSSVSSNNTFSSNELGYIPSSDESGSFSSTNTLEKNIEPSFSSTNTSYSTNSNESDLFSQSLSDQSLNQWQQPEEYQRDIKKYKEANCSKCIEVDGCCDEHIIYINKVNDYIKQIIYKFNNL